MRTLAQAEKDYDRALAEGAAAVQIMDQKLRDAQRMLAAVVLAAGGKVEVSHRDQIDCDRAVITVADNPAMNGITVSAKRK